MKKLLLVILIIFSGLYTSKYAHAADSPFDLILDNRNYQPITGNLSLFDFPHDTDPKAPQLGTLIEGISRPSVTSLYQVYDWDGQYYDRPADLPSNLDFAPVVGFNTQAGQNILVPESGYDIGGGYQVMVLYADNNSLTLNYTADGSIASGYTIHLENLQVNPELLSIYNQATSAENNQLPVLMANMIVGQAIGNEILVAMRDTGQFMDPRWLGDWWLTLDPATAKALLAKLLGLQGFGLCQAERDFPGGAQTIGDSYAVKYSSCFWNVIEPEDVVNALLKTAKIDFPQNEKIATNLNDSLDKLKPAGYTPQIFSRSTLGKITYEVCEEGTTNFYKVEKEIEDKIPAWMEKQATVGKELAKMLVPEGGKGGVLGEQNINPSSSQASPQLLAQAEAGSIPHGCKYYYSQNPNDPTDCSCMNEIKPDGEPNCRGEHGCCPMHGWWGICGWSKCYTQEKCDLNAACWGWVVGGQPLATPTPKICKKQQAEGGYINANAICVQGQCSVGIKSRNAAYDAWQTEIQINPSILGLPIPQAIANLLGCKEKHLLITPQIYTPYAGEADAFIRQETLSIFKIPSEDSLKAFEKEHALVENEQLFEASPVQISSTSAEIYGQKGVKDSYDWVQGALMPY